MVSMLESRSFHGDFVWSASVHWLMQDSANRYHLSQVSRSSYVQLIIQSNLYKQRMLDSRDAKEWASHIIVKGLFTFLGH